MNISKDGRLLEVTPNDLDSRGYLLLLDCNSIDTIANDAFDSCHNLKGIVVNASIFFRVRAIFPDKLKSKVIDAYSYEQDRITGSTENGINERSSLINEIDALLLINELKKLNFEPPSNRGLSLITSYHLQNMLNERIGAVNAYLENQGITNPFEIFRAMLLDSATHVELNKVFFHQSIETQQ